MRNLLLSEITSPGKYSTSINASTAIGGVKRSVQYVVFLVD